MTADQSHIVDMGMDEFLQKPELDLHLAYLAFLSLARNAGKTFIIDLATGRREMKAGLFLAVAIALSRRFRKMNDRRVGIVFPAGIPSALTNLALSMAGKSPVNMNFSAGRKSLESSLRKAGIRRIVTAKPVMNKLPNFPWPENVTDFVQLLGSIKRTEILYWYALVRTVPGPVLARWVGVPRNGGDREAAILFSSGSTGDPKGVVLTHRNIVGNCMQIRAVDLFRPDDVIIANLPTFHSFGFTVTMWYPMIEAIRIVCMPNPLETRRIAQAIHDEKVTFLIGTPTILRPYFKKTEPALLKSLRATVAGAEKTPSGFAELWEKTFGCKFIIGYGITETSPGVAADLDPINKDLPSTFSGSTGRPFAGMQACIVDDTTGEMIDPSRQGLLYLKGVNVFRGYLDDIEATNRAFVDGWFNTGDLARFDADGCLHIEGRISRFSKIGGEMVPHGTVEQAVVQAYGLEDSEVPMVAITGVTDDAKGESLVLFTAMDIDPADLRARLSAQSLPNLWIPRRILRVEAIPCLASGKLDLAALKTAAAQDASGADEEAV